MKRFAIGVALAALSLLASATTLNPVQLLNPAGSTAGQAPVSTGPSTVPIWGNVPATALASQAANTVVANITGSAASPTAFAMPSCSTSTSAIQYTSGTGFTCYASSATTTGTLAQFAATTSAQLAGVLSDETGTGFAVFSISPALTGTPTAPTAAVGTNTTQLATMAAVAAHARPYFQAYLSATQSIAAGSNTKVQFNTKVSDTGSYYDNATNFRYTPLITGNYLVTVQVTIQGTSTGTGQNSTIAGYIYKNGSPLSASNGALYFATSSLTLTATQSTTYLVNMNGSTDYLEGFGVITNVGTTQFAGGISNTFFQAIYVGP